MQIKMTRWLIILAGIVLISPQLALSADVCLSSSEGDTYYLELNESSGITGYVDLIGYTCPISGSYVYNEGYYYLAFDANCYCGEGMNPAKFVVKLSSVTLSGPSSTHAFRCDGTIDMFDDVTFSLCGTTSENTEKIEGPTSMQIK